MDALTGYADCLGDGQIKEAFTIRYFGLDYPEHETNACCDLLKAVARRCLPLMMTRPYMQDMDLDTNGR